MPIKLLHIEDNEDYRDLVNATLRLERSTQFCLVSVESLTEGLAVLREQGPFDAVLLDWTLQDSSGAASIAAIREIDPKISIVVFTGHDDVVEEAGTAGADGFLLKGANIKTVLTSLHFAASQRRPGDDVIAQLEAMLAGLESATGSLEEHIASENDHE